MTVLAQRMHAQGLGGQASDVLTAVVNAAACRRRTRPRAACRSGLAQQG